jgi:hypothetical protein
MAEAVEVTGDEQVIRDLRNKGDRAMDLTRVMDDLADFAERQIRPTHSNRTGTLTRSLYGGSNQVRTIRADGFDLGSTVDYSRFVFGGTKHMRARPPVINTSSIARRATAEINREIERA